MSTALMVDHDKRMKEMNEQAFERRLRSFIETWKPENRIDASDFEAQLVMLVRQIYTDAQAPLMDQITKIISAMPLLPIQYGK
jgi:hypothetical protein